ncbi:hypothetical protein TNCV_1480081 [Trichonephila clavipes]|nr:hypothetical protein TNCV_1480081 [Trichonephila clavipes]
MRHSENADALSVVESTTNAVSYGVFLLLYYLLLKRRTLLLNCPSYKVTSDQQQSMGSAPVQRHAFVPWLTIPERTLL